MIFLRNAKGKVSTIKKKIWENLKADALLSRGFDTHLEYNSTFFSRTCFEVKPLLAFLVLAFFYFLVFLQTRLLNPRQRSASAWRFSLKKKFLRIIILYTRCLYHETRVYDGTYLSVLNTSSRGTVSQIFTTLRGYKVPTLYVINRNRITKYLYVRYQHYEVIGFYCSKSAVNLLIKWAGRNYFKAQIFFV